MEKNNYNVLPLIFAILLQHYETLKIPPAPKPLNSGNSKAEYPAENILALFMLKKAGGKV